MADSPEHHGAIHLVEGISRIKKKKAPVWLMSVGFPKCMNSMNCSLDTCGKANTELVDTTGGSGNITYRFEETFGKKPAPDLTDPNRSNTGTLVKSY
jgi:hypothetical protein